jgi:hypothetical protein
MVTEAQQMISLLDRKPFVQDLTDRDTAYADHIIVEQLLILERKVNPRVTWSDAEFERLLEFAVLSDARLLHWIVATRDDDKPVERRLL